MKRDSNKDTAIQANISKDNSETYRLSQADTKVQINQLEFRIMNQRFHQEEKQKIHRKTLLYLSFPRKLLDEDMNHPFLIKRKSLVRIICGKI
jgi:hypothetical protein